VDEPFGVIEAAHDARGRHWTIHVLDDGLAVRLAGPVGTGGAAVVRTGVPERNACTEGLGPNRDILNTRFNVY